MGYLLKNMLCTLSRSTSYIVDAMNNLNVFAADDRTVCRAVDLLKQGNVVALPTDTIYGIASDAKHFAAVQQLYKIKGRDFNKPIAICVGDVKDIKLWGRTDSLPDNLLDNLLPGPVTVLLKRLESVSLNLNPGVDKVGIRVPDSDFIRKVASSLDSAIALTSANISDEPSTLSIEEFEHLWPQLAGVFDAGHLGESRAGSTIVDLSVSGKFTVVRAGSALHDTLDVLQRFGLEKS